MSMSDAPSPPALPTYVEYRSVDPSRLIDATKASNPPALVGWNAPAGVGKSVDAVKPARYTTPLGLTASPSAVSIPEPPRRVEYTRLEPEGSSFATNASVSPANVSSASVVVGKSVDPVAPAM